jgi:hypothetical protein
MRFRKLRIAWSVLWGIAFVLLIALWVRSYWRCDICGLTLDAQKRWNFCSVEGRIFLIVPDCTSANWAIGKSREWDIRSEYVPYVSNDGEPFLYLNGFDGYYRAIVPHLMLAAFAIPLGAIPWIRYRFSLRTLLIATTLVAVVLGLIVAVV